MCFREVHSMAVAKVRNTYNAAEVASLESTSRLSRSDSGKAGSDRGAEAQARPHEQGLRQCSAFQVRSVQWKAFLWHGWRLAKPVQRGGKVPGSQGGGTHQRNLYCQSPCPKEKKTIDEMANNLDVEEALLRLHESQLVCDKCGCTFMPIVKNLFAVKS